MGNPIYVIAYDVGTTGVKTCLFSITDKIELLGAASEGYNLYVYPDGGAEQDPDEWWEAMRTSTHAVMKKPNKEERYIRYLVLLADAGSRSR